MESGIIMTKAIVLCSRKFLMKNNMSIDESFLRKRNFDEDYV